MSLIDENKDVADLIKKVGDLELYRKIVSLESEIIDLTRGKREADEQIVELTRALKLKGELVFREPFYFLEGDRIPFCPNCWETKNMAVHITHSNTNAYGQWWDCPACKVQYSLKKPLPRV